MELLQKKTICLGMIVKNESHIIVDTLKHLSQYISFDYWVINDNGSTDGTQDLIKNYFKEKNIPGELDETPWKDFAYNRTIVFERAYKKTNYIFVWDADDYIVGNLKLPKELKEDSYLFSFKEYNRVQLFNNHLKWHYVGVIHEIANCLEKSNDSFFVEGDYHFVSDRRGSRNKDPNKYLKDALILEKAFNESFEKGDVIYNRYVYYTAQSYDCCGNNEKAIEFYKKTLDLYGWSEEKYISCIKLYEKLKNLNREQEGLYYLVKSLSYNNKRIEGIYRLLKYYSSNKMDDIAYKYYLWIQEFYEDYKKSDISQFLFVNHEEYDFYFPYYVIIIAERAKNLKTAGKMYEIIFKNKCVTNEFFVTNLIFNIQFCLDGLPKTIDFLQSMLVYIDLAKNKGINIDDKLNSIISRVIDLYRDELTSYTLSKIPSNKNKPTVMLTMTTCKRFDLFTKTINSILNCWTDIFNVDYFFCVDDNSSEKDREEMKTIYPFFDFYMKTHSEKGHRESMNIIWSKLNELKPKYWIHLEDDWLFFRKDNYVQKSIDFLQKYKSMNIHQILYNRHYSEVYTDLDINGGAVLESDYLIHLKTDNISGKNCGYWPHYSFRPSMTCTDIILSLGNYDSPNTFFEMDYSHKYFNKGYKSGFFNTICSIHIGKLTSDKEGINAYKLNDVGQFKNNINTFVVNLERRKDRRQNIENLFKSVGITSYSFFTAVDGKSLVVTNEIINLFKGNDFSNRRGVIGCALSHYKLWKQLQSDKVNDYYLIYEDDITISDENDYIRKLENVKRNLVGKDVVFLGYSVRNKDNYRLLETNQDLVELDKNIYIGGFFSYIITKSGCDKLLSYIEKNGIKHGIDYLIKISDNLKIYNTQPSLVFSEWVQSSNSNIDTDIQKDYESLSLDIVPLDLTKEWDYYDMVDSFNYDISHVGNKSLQELFVIANEITECVAFNTLGFFKSKVTFPLQSSSYLNSNGNGLYVKKSYKKKLYEEEWDYYDMVDSFNYDIYLVRNKSLEELFTIANKTDNCVAFNTLGFLKYKITFPLQPSSYLNSNGTGLYVKKSYKRIYRVKMICNWCSSKDLCDEWLKMSKGSYKWNDIEITWTDDDIDYYVIINKPKEGDVYEPSKTIIFHMEPWCYESYQNWGIKTWGEWSDPDQTKFLQVHSHKKCLQTAFWQVNWTYDDFKTKQINKSDNLNEIVSSICSSNYVDPGHVKRIDFLKFIESKSNKDSIKLHIYGKDNKHNFTSYKEKIFFTDKEKGILSYKYYFMCENNSEHNYISEKLWEPILCETLCFYWGCPNVTDHIDPMAYVLLDMNDFESAYETMKDAIQNNLWEKRLPYIKKAKEDILEKQGFFPILENIISKKLTIPMFNTTDLAFYTCFYGSNKNNAFLIPDLPTLKYKCYYYTNNKDIFNQLKGTKWIGVYHDIQTNDDLIESAMASKHIKAMPHEYKELQNYSYLCYFDSKVNGLSEKYIETYINKYFIEQNNALIVREHRYIQNNVWEEYNECIKQHRYMLESDKYKKYIQTQINNGLSEKTKNHCMTGVLIRNMKHEKINELGSLWYKNIQECGIQCQISFFFTKQMYNDCIKYVNDHFFIYTYN